MRIVQVGNFSISGIDRAVFDGFPPGGATPVVGVEVETGVVRGHLPPEVSCIGNALQLPVNAVQGLFDLGLVLEENIPVDFGRICRGQKVVTGSEYQAAKNAQ